MLICVSMADSINRTGHGGIGANNGKLNCFYVCHCQVLRAVPNPFVSSFSLQGSHHRPKSGCVRRGRNQSELSYVYVHFDFVVVIHEQIQDGPVVMDIVSVKQSEIPLTCIGFLSRQTCPIYTTAIIDSSSSYTNRSGHGKKNEFEKESI